MQVPLVYRKRISKIIRTNHACTVKEVTFLHYNALYTAQYIVWSERHTWLQHNGHLHVQTGNTIRYKMLF